MNDELDSRVDDELRSVGAEWRSRRPIRAGLDPSLFAERRPRTLQAAFASVAGALTLIVAAVIVIVSLPPSAPGPGTATASPTAISGASVAPTASVQPITTAPTASAQPTSPPSPPLPTSTPSESPTPSPTNAADGISWERFEAMSPEFEGNWSIQVVDGRFLASADRCQDRRACEFVLLESADAEEWTVIASIPSRKVDALGVTWFHESGLGFLASANRRSADPGVALYHSIDGISWERLGDQFTFERAECEPVQVNIIEFFRTAGEIVALGRAGCTDSTITGEPNLAWTSVDGRTWQATESVPVSSVLADHGTFVGRQFVAEGTIWQSDDGLVWDVAAQPGEGLDLGSVSTGFVAVGYAAGEGATVVLTSPDGKTWVERQALDARQDPTGRLASDGQRAAVVESFSDANVAWVSSPDGTDWSSYTMPTGTGELANGIAILGDRLVAYSHSEFGVWVGDIP
jgi:hypothetical protein